VIVAALPQNIAVIALVVFVLGWIGFIALNIFSKRGGKAEVGSEVELAPNRKPYYDDEGLEGPRLERAQKLAVGMLAVVALGLPFYWIHEPYRQKGAVVHANNNLVKWGSQLFDTTANGGFNCAGCHGGMKAAGGGAPFTIVDPNTGEVKAVTWNAPALNTVFYRFTDDEVTFILTYGRPFSPMSPWGLAGGGPMNDQQIASLVAYLHSIQIPMEGCTQANPLCNAKNNGHIPAGDAKAATAASYSQDAIQRAAQAEVDAGRAKSIGEALFSLQLDAGAYSCARCHTKGWSYGDPQTTGGGAMGPNLTGGSEARQFPKQTDNENFICLGSELGKKYGQQGQGSGRMPAFCGLLSQDQITAVVEYIRSL
jgi:mono/diheme cytochrome c family protein